MTTAYQKDLKIVIPEGLNRKATLDLSPTGDVQLHEGREKLSSQILRTIVNEESLGRNLLNKKTVKYRQIKTLLTILLRNFRQIQINEVKFYDPDVTGYSVWRRAAGSDERFKRISDRAQTWKYVDTELNNGTEYEYGITKLYKDSYETNFIENFVITPSSFLSKKDFVLGSSTVAIPENRQVIFYFDYNRYFKGSELLETIDNIRSYVPEEEPRQLIIEIIGRDLNGNKTTISNNFIRLGS